MPSTCSKIQSCVKVCFEPANFLFSISSVRFDNAKPLAGVKEYSDWPTIPQLYLEKEFVGGCDILVSMHQNGELAKLLEGKGVLVAADQ